jgi:peptide/nickel transport system substrate-binding protein
VKAIALAVAVASVMSGAPRELRFAMAGDPRTFDPLHAEESHSEMVRYLTGGVLLRVNRATGKVEPELAESYQITEGGRTIQFRLRAGLKFSDGSPLTSADVTRTLTRALDPKEASPIGDTFRSAEGDPMVRAASPLEIAVRYRLPKPDLDRLFDSLAIAPAAMAKLPATAGPFHVTEYRAGQYVRLERNPNYWKRDPNGRPLPLVDSIRIDIQQNHDIELERFLRRDLQVINKLEPEGFDRVQQQMPGAAKSLGASLDSEFLWFNEAPVKSLPEWKLRWFRSTAFRHAVSLAIQRDDLARLAYRGHAHPASGPISPANRFWFNAALKPLPANPQRALQLLAGDGFSFQSGVLRDRDGHAVEFSLITNSGNRPRERMAQLIQQDLARIGVKINIVPLEFGALIERIAKTLDYESALLGFANVEEDPVEQMNVWISSGAQHAWWPRQKTPATAWEARIDALEKQQASSPDRAARKKAMDEVQAIAVEQEPIIYLLNPDYLYAVAPGLKGLQPSAAPPQILWNVEWLRLE